MSKMDLTFENDKYEILEGDEGLVVTNITRQISFRVDNLLKAAEAVAMLHLTEPDNTKPQVLAAEKIAKLEGVTDVQLRGTVVETRKKVVVALAKGPKSPDFDRLRSLFLERTGTTVTMSEVFEGTEPGDLHNEAPVMTTPD